MWDVERGMEVREMGEMREIGEASVAWDTDPGWVARPRATEN
jgi:hypothetical protein